MRRLVLVSLIALLLPPDRASAQSAKEQHDKTVDFSSYRSYAWSSPPNPKGKETGERWVGWETQLVELLDAELPKKGLAKKDAAEAQLVLTRITQVKDKMAETVATAPGSGNSRGGGTRGTRYRELTFEVMMTDAGTQKQVWKGKVVTEIELPEQVHPRLQASIEKLLTKYPPGKK